MLAYRACFPPIDERSCIIKKQLDERRRLSRDEALQLVDGEPPIEIDEPPDKPPSPADAEISLSALKDVSKSTIIRFDTTIRQEPAAAFVDSASSHNFVSYEVAERLFLRSTEIPPFEVKVINEDSLLCQRCYEAVPIEIQGVQIQADLYELPLRGVDVVLGGQWLKHASPISFDWRNATMRFKDKGSWVTLQGAINPDNEDTAADGSLRDNDVKPRKTGCRNRGGQSSLQTSKPMEPTLKEVSPAIDVVLSAATSATSSTWICSTTVREPDVAG
ncbi:unnamed protein product [Linum trigynum]|uniref:Uncharacterized protein n=1 Tax=Linum trigynum TaxID=586398 RepID=A0AAV2GQH5_9ROSI